MNRLLELLLNPEQKSRLKFTASAVTPLDRRLPLCGTQINNKHQSLEEKEPLIYSPSCRDGGMREKKRREEWRSKIHLIWIRETKQFCSLCEYIFLNCVFEIFTIIIHRNKVIILEINLFFSISVLSLRFALILQINNIHLSNENATFYVFWPTFWMDANFKKGLKVHVFKNTAIFVSV